jgi:hypothetical protein
VARKVVDELNRRIDSDASLSDVDTVHLLKFLQSVMPRESVGSVDHNIKYISSTPRPAIPHKTHDIIDITPDATVDSSDGEGTDGHGSHTE